MIEEDEKQPVFQKCQCCLLVDTLAGCTDFEKESLTYLSHNINITNTDHNDYVNVNYLTIKVVSDHIYTNIITGCHLN